MEFVISKLFDKQFEYSYTYKFVLFIKNGTPYKRPMCYNGANLLEIYKNLCLSHANFAGFLVENEY